MIIAKGNLTGNLVGKQPIQGKVNKTTEYIIPTTQEKTITPTKQIQEVLPDENIDLLSKVTVNAIPNEYIVPQGETTINQNGIVNVSQYASANVNVPIPTPNLQNKSITITENGTNMITPDTGYDGLNEVEITANVGGENEYNAKVDGSIVYSAGIGVKGLITKIANMNANNVANLNSMFSGCENLVDVSLINTNNTTDMAFMFSSCTKLKTIQLSNTGNVTNMQSMFNKCQMLPTIPFLDTHNVTNMNYMFEGCKNIISIPLLDTSNVTTMLRMFNGCNNLTNIPAFNLSKVTNMRNMFAACYNISDDSLNNILAMCISATSYNSTKTLSYIGISNYTYPVSKIQSLSNYQAFLNAGWTI